MIKKGSLTHNGCYPIRGPKRRTDYESTIKKGVYRSHFFTVKKAPRKERTIASLTNSARLADITESMQFDYSEDLDAS